jgi:uncharacterized protein (TIGR02001 family)
VRFRFTVVLGAALCALAASPGARADPSSAERWNGPFGGHWSANVTAMSDYSQAGISVSNNHPAFQVGLDWQSPGLLTELPSLRAYVGALGTTVDFPNASPGVEVTLQGGLKLDLMGDKLHLEASYARYVYPDYPAAAGLEYGEWTLRAEYDFGPFAAQGRLRWSPDTVAHAGQSWNKRGLVAVPLTFLTLPFDATLKAYGSLGNIWIEKPDLLGLPAHDYWYWQIGLVTSVWGLDVTLAYTDTNITSEGCGFTRACEGRIFASVTKLF